MKKSGFTMIELIFVIVILGILAAVAVPKLNATRADAEAAKGASNVSTLIGDTYSYYTAQGEFADTLTNMQAITNVVLKNGNLQVNGKDCLAVSRVNEHELKFQKTPGNAVCDKVLNIDSIKSMFTVVHNACLGKKAEGADKATLTDVETAAGCTTVGTPVMKSLVDEVTKTSTNNKGEEVKTQEGYPITINYQGNGVKW